MNPRIAKITREIDKSKAKISELQLRVKDLQEQKTELENSDIIALFRSLSMTPQDLAEFIHTNRPAVSQPPEQEQTAENEKESDEFED